jgi:hypothetical protein
MGIWMRWDGGSAQSAGRARLDLDDGQNARPEDELRSGKDEGHGVGVRRDGAGKASLLRVAVFADDELDRGRHSESAHGHS